VDDVVKHRAVPLGYVRVRHTITFVTCTPVCGGERSRYYNHPCL